ncbi:MAG: ABC transporter permease subunit [Turicibacter sp.]|nr:ABC transporter permease subunit [Turicibacter sp.]
MRKNKSAFAVYLIILAVFAIFLGFPVLRLFQQALTTDRGFDPSQFIEVMGSPQLRQAFMGSVAISLKTSILATALGFIIAYALNFTRLFKGYKRFVELVVTIPMLSPTIVYGFAMIYTFGRQGILTRFLGFQLFDIYSTTGLLIGFLIYTVPISFMLLNNSMKYIDAQFFTVSELMGDNGIKKFWNTIMIPMLTSIGLSMVQTFFLSFTDFGLPASIAANRPLVSGLLFTQMIGAVPDFTRGAVVAIAMLLPAIATASLMLWLRRYDVKYDKISAPLLKPHPVREWAFLVATLIPAAFIILTFASVFVVPFVESYPFNLGFTWRHFINALNNREMVSIYQNSLWLSVLTGIFGLILSFTAALVVRRSSLGEKWTNVIEAMSQVTNAIPGMVLGVSFLFAFTGTTLQNSLAILVICNVIYFFPTPFAMASQTLEKLSGHFEKTAALLGDNYLQTLVRVIIPNCKKTFAEIFGYLFIHSMVTISALIFLVGVRTATITTRISALQNFNRFDEIFVLALLLLATNLIAKLLLGFLSKPRAMKVKEAPVKAEATGRLMKLPMKERKYS